MAPTHGAKAHYVKLEMPNILLKKEGQKYIQAVTRSLLYYSQAINPTMLVALNAIATQQVSPTQQMMKWAKQLLDYCVSQEEVVLTYHASEMILAIHRNAGY